MNQPSPPLNPAYLRDHPILYVDDEEANLVVFQAEFGEEFRIFCVRSGDEALEVLGQQRVGVLLADQRMPGMTGIELCERVAERYPEVLRLLVTAYSDQKTAIAAINRGGVLRYLVKPWEAEEIAQILRDVVARAELSDQLRRLRGAFVQSERDAALAAARAQLLHDLSNPVTVISDCGSALEELIATQADFLQPRVLDVIRKELQILQLNARQMMNLFERQRELKQAAQGSRATLRVHDVLRMVSQLLHAGRPGAPKLTLNCPPTLALRANYIDLSRILANLVLNGWQAMQQVGIDAGEVRVEASLEGAQVQIDIVDHGPGVPVELHQRLFEPGYTTRGNANGSGLGLSICRELAQANDGTVELIPTPAGQGARFRVRLPAVT